MQEWIKGSIREAVWSILSTLPLEMVALIIAGVVLACCLVSWVTKKMTKAALVFGPIAVAVALFTGGKAVQQYREREELPPVIEHRTEILQVDPLQEVVAQERRALAEERRLQREELNRQAEHERSLARMKAEHQRKLADIKLEAEQRAEAERMEREKLAVASTPMEPQDYNTAIDDLKRQLDQWHSDQVRQEIKAAQRMRRFVPSRYRSVEHETFDHANMTMTQFYHLQCAACDKNFEVWKQMDAINHRQREAAQVKVNRQISGELQREKLFKFYNLHPHLKVVAEDIDAAKNQGKQVAFKVREHFGDYRYFQSSASRVNVTYHRDCKLCDQIAEAHGKVDEYLRALKNGELYDPE